MTADKIDLEGILTTNCSTWIMSRDLVSAINGRIQDSQWLEVLGDRSITIVSSPRLISVHPNSKPFGGSIPLYEANVAITAIRNDEDWIHRKDWLLSLSSDRRREILQELRAFYIPPTSLWWPARDDSIDLNTPVPQIDAVRTTSVSEDPGRYEAFFLWPRRL